MSNRDIDSKQLEKAFIRDAKEISGKRFYEDKLIAIDGKQSDIPNTHQNQCSFSMGDHMGVGQVKTNEKSNEITAPPEHLEHLDLKGVIVIQDALVDVRRK